MNPTVIRPLVAEFVGTALFVFLGAGSVVVNAASNNALGVVGIAFAHGIAIAVVVTATLNISGGHVNPAVTLALFAARKVDGRTAGSYVGAQLLGAVLGAFLVRSLFPAGAVGVTGAGTPGLAAALGFWPAVGIEAVLTFVLVSAVFGTAVSSEAPKVGGLAIGMAVLVGAVAAGPMTGAVMNPARALGPALVTMHWQAQAVYWIGPVIGALAASALWQGILLPRGSQ